MNSQEVQLYAALPQGLFRYEPTAHALQLEAATVIRAWFDRHALSEAMNLGADQQLLLAQTVGVAKGDG